ncbi:MAG: amidohydrolase family protein [Spirochaetaceae bacterium]|nr:amidohydrolase family protein [Spirochaetaceae bacterium]
MYDLVIRNGTLVDGTGASRRIADVGILGGRIVELGRIDASQGRRVIEAEGLVVAPGLIDLHTHYDPQLTLDPFASSSCFHGVTSVVTGNCGFAVAPTRPSAREGVKQIFARVEEIDLDVLDRMTWDFETVPELLTAREGGLGVNAAFYIGHSNLRLWVLGEAAYEREATEAEVAAMRAIVREAMTAGAAGFSSSHSPTDLDLQDRPVPSRLSSLTELEALADEVGRSNAGSIAYLPRSAVGGLSQSDGELLIRLALGTRRPVIIQGLGARSKVDAPTATWPRSEAYLEHARKLGAPVYSLLIARPFQRPFDLVRGTTMFEGALAFHRLFSEAKDVPTRMAMLRDPAYRDAIRHCVEHPNHDPEAGPTTPPPQLETLFVHRVRDPANRALEGRRLVDLAKERGVAPMDALVDLAASEDLETVFLWNNDTPEWRDGTALAMAHPQMLVGTSDGGAHLGRDDNAEFSSYFLRYWVREWGRVSLEQGIRELTAIPAALLGLTDRGLVLPGCQADLFLFDPDTIGPDRKWLGEDRIPGQTRWTSRPRGVRATIVNGVPIVEHGELVDERARPGQVLRPTRVGA